MSCTACGEGKTSASGSTKENGCRTCAKGKYGETQGQKECKVCPAEYYQPQDTDSKKSLVCTACPLGWTQKEEGQSFCNDPGGIQPENCGDDE
jgi:hypothetical protein